MMEMISYLIVLGDFNHGKTGKAMPDDQHDNYWMLILRSGQP